LVVDSIISGESSQEISSRVAALGWRADGQVAVLLGSTPSSPDPDSIRRIARKSGADVLIGIQGRRQVVVIGLVEPSSSPGNQIHEIAERMEGLFGATPLILGTVVGAVSDANRSAKAALSAYSVAPAVEIEARPLIADELLPERALAGDSLARSSLVSRYYQPLATSSPELLITLRTFLDSGRSLEACSKRLFVHANTVRYRLRKIFDEIGLDATDPRGGFVLQIAVLLGAINDAEAGLRR
jgi:sugar diacid utilization regulator